LTRQALDPKLAGVDGLLAGAMTRDVKLKVKRVPSPEGQENLRLAGYTGSYKLSLFPWHSRRFANEPAELQIVRCRHFKIGYETPNLRDPAEAPHSPPGSPELLCGGPVLLSDMWHRHDYCRPDGSFLESFDVF
jgi:hypothetical protein